MDDFSQLAAGGSIHQQMIRAAEAGRSIDHEDQFIMRSSSLSSILINNMITTRPSISDPHHLPAPRAPSFSTSSSSQAEASAVKARIIAHPHYPNLVGAYVDCHKVGAPPDVATRLSAVARQLEIPQHAAGSGGVSTADPELDQFMEAYYDMLVKYREELSRPLEEAADFLRETESQLNSCISDSRSSLAARLLDRPADNEKFGACSSEEDRLDASLGEIVLEGEPRSEERELKHRLLRKYSGFLGSLRQELSKKRKKEKLPKEARQKLLSWWELHKKWPYPSESEKVALVESTGLNQKQINNWFINQRKRHWKPSDEMQFMVLDGYHHQQNASSFYMEGHLMEDGSLYRIGQ